MAVIGTEPGIRSPSVAAAGPVAVTRGSRRPAALGGASRWHGNVGLVQLVFDALAGAAALVALIIAYRRHKSAEFVAARNRVEAQLEHARLYHEPFAAAAAQIGDETAAAANGS